VDVWVVFRVYVFELGMEGLVAGAGQAGKSLVDLDEGITDMKVGVVVISREPAGSCVGYLVGLGREALTLYKSAKGSV
jgi:L-asparaginase/Glu-tRNA(Gln) amidotransferase subunit D